MRKRSRKIQATIALAFAALVFGLAQRWRRFQSVDAVIAAEDAVPELGQRLRTSHDYATDPRTTAPADPELVQALERQTEDQVSAVELPGLGSNRPVALLLGLVGVVLVGWMVGLFTVPQWNIATARLMLLPAHYSSVDVDPLPTSISQGEDLSITVHVAGRPVKQATAFFRTEDQPEWTRLPLQPSSGEQLVGTVKGQISKVQRDLKLRITAGEFSSPVHHIAVKAPIVLQQWNATVTPPPYTGLPEQQGTLETLSIPEGSQIRVEAVYSRMPSVVDATIGPEAGHKLPVERQDGSSVHFSFQAGREPIELTARATTDDGMSDESSVRIDVIPDRAPSIQFASPAKDSEAIATAELEFVPEAIDDYKLTTVGIRYRVDDGEEQILWESQPGESEREVRTSIRMALEEMNLSHPQAITYYAYAVDNRGDQPQRVTSDLRFVDIRPFDRSYEFAEGQCNSNCQGECVSLEKIIKQQRQILGRTFAAANQSTPISTILQKLSAQQLTLTDQTEQLAAALEQKVGPMPNLWEAVSAMNGATEFLRQTEVLPAQEREETALAKLVSARRNLRKILKQSNAQSQACKNVDQQQMDKLRKPESEKQQQEQDQQQKLASIRKQLEEMATQQESFCQSAKACSNPSSQTSAKQLAQQQRSAAERADQLKRQLEQQPFGSLAPERLADAAESIRKSAESVKPDSENEDAVTKANDAAKKFRDLSEHLRRRHLPDFEDKLELARRQAERIAEEQQALSESVEATTAENRVDSAGQNSAGETSKAERADASSFAPRQREVASATEELSDLVDQLSADSLDQQWQVQKSLLQESSATAPGRAAAEMRHAAEAMDQERALEASSSGKRAARTLQNFASDLKRLQEAIGPARLEQLTQAEQRVAQAKKQLERRRRPAEQARVLAEIPELARSIQQLLPGDSELQQAASRLAEAASGGTVRRTSDQRDEDVPGSETLDRPTTSVVEGLRDVGVVLQQRIQETILSGALQQNDHAVPPDYVEIVEEYYRVLSEDIE